MLPDNPVKLPDETPIDDLDLSPRLVNACKAHGWRTVADLRYTCDEVIFYAKGIGRVFLGDIREIVPFVPGGKPPA
jgi:DNA-directed RNA polymerase alpha subunit